MKILFCKYTQFLLLIPLLGFSLPLCPNCFSGEAQDPSPAQKSEDTIGNAQNDGGCCMSSRGENGNGQQSSCGTVGKNICSLYGNRGKDVQIFTGFHGGMTADFFSFSPDVQIRFPKNRRVSRYIYNRSRRPLIYLQKSVLLC